MLSQNYVNCLSALKISAGANETELALLKNYTGQYTFSISAKKKNNLPTGGPTTQRKRLQLMTTIPQTFSSNLFQFVLYTFRYYGALKRAERNQTW